MPRVCLLRERHTALCVLCAHKSKSVEMQAIRRAAVGGTRLPRYYAALRRGRRVIWHAEITRYVMTRYASSCAGAVSRARMSSGAMMACKIEPVMVQEKMGAFMLCGAGIVLRAAVKKRNAAAACGMLAQQFVIVDVIHIRVQP